MQQRLCFDQGQNSRGLPSFAWINLSIVLFGCPSGEMSGINKRVHLTESFWTQDTIQLRFVSSNKEPQCPYGHNVLSLYPNPRTWIRPYLAEKHLRIGTLLFYHKSKIAFQRSLAKSSQLQNEPNPPFDSPLILADKLERCIKEQFELLRVGDGRDLKTNLISRLDRKTKSTRRNNEFQGENLPLHWLSPRDRHCLGRWR